MTLGCQASSGERDGPGPSQQSWRRSASLCPAAPYAQRDQDPVVAMAPPCETISLWRIQAKSVSVIRCEPRNGGGTSRCGRLSICVAHLDDASIQSSALDSRRSPSRKQVPSCLTLSTAGTVPAREIRTEVVAGIGHGQQVGMRDGGAQVVALGNFFNLSDTDRGVSSVLVGETHYCRA